jgi:hypothetical protein
MREQKCRHCWGRIEQDGAGRWFDLSGAFTRYDCLDSPATGHRPMERESWEPKPEHA